jgi:hypothetical protein
MSNFATHFPNIEEIPMGHLIDKLKNLRQVENPDEICNIYDNNNNNMFISKAHKYYSSYINNASRKQHDIMHNRKT